MTPKSDIIPAQPVKQSLVAKIAGKYSVEAQNLLSTLKETVFKNASNEQLCALLVVADQYDLNPFTKEIYAFPAQGGIVPIVGIDGWISILNRQATLQSVEFRYSDEEDEDGVPEWIECVITRSDRTAAISAREYFDECYRDTGPWKSHPRRMLRHKALVQAARIAYGFSGIYDPDEGERIIESVATDVTNRKPATDAPVEKIEHRTQAEDEIEKAAADAVLTGQGVTVTRVAPENIAVKLARPNQLKLLREVIGKYHVDEDQVCLHFDVAKLEDLEFDTVDVALAFIKGKPKAQS